MSECIRECRLCNKLILSTSINYDANTNTVIVGLPAGSYGNNCKYCIVLAQSIPTGATISSTVAFSIGTDPTQYPFVNCNCTPVYACQIKTRRIYPTRVNTSISSGVFKYIGKCKLPCNPDTAIQSLPVATPTTPTP